MGMFSFSMIQLPKINPTKDLGRLSMAPPGYHPSVLDCLISKGPNQIVTGLRSVSTSRATSTILREVAFPKREFKGMIGAKYRDA